MKNKFKKYFQENIFKKCNQMTLIEKKDLKRNIKNINIKFMKKLYKRSFKDKKCNIKYISDLKVIKKSSRYEAIGIDTIKKDKYGIVIMAGGNGSRLGFNGPKGCLKLNINGKNISIFEIYVNKLMKIAKEMNIFIPLYIMTSTNNYKETVSFFKENTYFNYPKEKIVFFKQNELPILDIKGKFILDNTNHILFGPNGNGDVFKSLRQNNLIKHMYNNNLKYLSFISVDNILNNIVDFDFIGSMIANNYKVASKTIQSNQKEWIFCKYKNHPFILPKEELTDELYDKKKNDSYIYRFKNITYHLIDIDLVDKFSKMDIKYHRAFKKSLNANSPNSFKFEKFIFDFFYYADNMLLYEIKEDEFWPIKTKDDIQIAIEKYKSKKDL